MPAKLAGPLSIRSRLEGSGTTARRTCCQYRTDSNQFPAHGRCSGCSGAGESSGEIDLTSSNQLFWAASASEPVSRHCIQDRVPAFQSLLACRFPPTLRPDRILARDEPVRKSSFDPNHPNSRGASPGPGVCRLSNSFEQRILEVISWRLPSSNNWTGFSLLDPGDPQTPLPWPFVGDPIL